MQAFTCIYPIPVRLNAMSTQNQQIQYNKLYRLTKVIKPALYEVLRSLSDIAKRAAYGDFRNIQDFLFCPLHLTQKEWQLRNMKKWINKEDNVVRCEELSSHRIGCVSSTFLQTQASTNSWLQHFYYNKQNKLHSRHTVKKLKQQTYLLPRPESSTTETEASAFINWTKKWFTVVLGRRSAQADGRTRGASVGTQRCDKVTIVSAKALVVTSHVVETVAHPQKQRRRRQWKPKSAWALL